MLVGVAPLPLSFPPSRNTLLHKQATLGKHFVPSVELKYVKICVV